ncbi:MAG: S16 family serine protease [Methanomicrobiaceae archaeon]|nr:S16 family serine protease [Methanomicrobiaceae archaeon]
MRAALAILLILSLIGNLYLLATCPVGQERGEPLQQQLQETEGALSACNARLDICLQEGAEEEVANSLLVSGRNASALAPAVMRVPTGVPPFGMLQKREEGTMMKISVEAVPGRGRVLVQTTPLMGVVFQDAANTAVNAAEHRTGRSLLGYDTIFSIHAGQEIAAVDGPSAGALMSLLVLSIIEDEEIRGNVTLTGTIDETGDVGAVSGIVEKATAARAAGKDLLLIPRENRELVVATETIREYYGFQLVERTGRRVDAKEYIEEEVGIRVRYVDTLADVKDAMIG